VRALPRRTEHGSGSILMVGVLCVVLMFGLAAVWVSGYLVAGHRARAAADLAALSGAAAFASGADSCGAARRNAESNTAVGVSCQQVGDQLDFVVTVEVEVPVQSRVAGLPRSVRAKASAGAVSG
jgi:secretion/DNA translocation related TadE-like protein